MKRLDLNLAITCTDDYLAAERAFAIANGVSPEDADLYVYNRVLVQSAANFMQALEMLLQQARMAEPGNEFKAEGAMLNPDNPAGPKPVGHTIAGVLPEFQTVN